MSYFIHSFIHLTKYVLSLPCTEHYSRLENGETVLFKLLLLLSEGTLWAREQHASFKTLKRTHFSQFVVETF